MEKTEWILDCSIEKILEILFYYMGMFDDATQLAEDSKVSDFIASSYNEIDALYHKVKNSGTVTPAERNSARITIKETYKMIVLFNLYDFTNEQLTSK